MISNLVKKAEALAPEDTLGKAVARLSDNTALPVLDKTYQGMLYLRDLVVRDVDTTTKIGPLIKKPRKIEIGAEDSEVMEAFMEYPVLPVFDRGSFKGTITLLDFLSAINLKGKACEYSAETDFVSSNEGIGTARNALKAKEVVLVRKNGNIIGGIDALSLVKQIIPKGNRTFAPDKIAEKNIKIETVMEENIEVDLNTGISKAIDLLRKKSYLVCGEFVITPRTILEALRSEKGEKKETTLELVGFDFASQGDGEVSSFEGSVALKEIENFAKRTEKRLRVNKIKFHLQVSQKPGKDLYEVYAKVILSRRIINAHVQGYKILDLVQDIIGKLDTQLEKIRK